MGMSRDEQNCSEMGQGILLFTGRLRFLVIHYFSLDIYYFGLLGRLWPLYLWERGHACRGHWRPLDMRYVATY